MAVFAHAVWIIGFAKSFTNMVFFHKTIISNFAGEVKKSLITTIRHNTLYKTLSLGYPDMPDIPDMKVWTYTLYAGLINQICLIWIQDDGLIPSQNRLRRLVRYPLDGLVSKLNLTDIFKIWFWWRKVEWSGWLGAFIDGVRNAKKSLALT